MDNQQHNRPILKSPEELKGGEARRPKKKGMNRWLSLLLVVVIAAGGWAVYRFTDVFAPAEQPQPTAAPQTAVKLIEKTPADFVSASVQPRDSAGYTVVSHLEYDEEGKTKELPAGQQEYSIEGMDYFKTNQANCRSLENQFSTLSATNTAAEDAQDLSAYGLDAPSLTVTARFRDGSESVLRFGDMTPMNNSYYATLDGGNAVYVVGTAAYNAASKTLEQMHALDMPASATLGSESFQNLLIEQQGKDTIELARSGEASQISLYTLFLVQPIRYEANIERGPALVEAVSAVTLSGYIGHADTPEALGQYGLGEPRARVVFSDTEGKSLEMRIGSQVDELYSYIAVDNTGDVYLVENKLIAFLEDARAPYLVDQFANLVNIEKVDSLTVTSGTSSYVLSIDREAKPKEDGTEEVVATYKFDGEVQDEKQFKGLYQEIIALMFDKMKQGDAPAGDVVATVTYKLNTGEADIVTQYLSYDKDYYAINRDGQMLFLIKHDKVENMVKECQNFRDGTYVRK